MKLLNYSTLLFFACCSVSCSLIDRKQAEQSLQGNWNVTSIFSQEKDASGPNRDGEHEEFGQLGTFSFSGNRVIYGYTRLGITYSDTSPWELTREVVPSGFFTATNYTLSLRDKAYDVSFGDRTSDSERDAKELELRLISDMSQKCHYPRLNKQ